MQKRLEELKNLVKKGNISAAFSLAEAFKWGLGGESDPKNAARMYRICCRSREKKTAARGYYNLGLLYYYGIEQAAFQKTGKSLRRIGNGAFFGRIYPVII